MTELALLWIAFCGVFVLRDANTMRIRVAIARTYSEEDPCIGMRMHDALPAYSDMVLHPAFWLKWTEADWREYVERRIGEQV